ncbi:MAG: hypothetical protein WBI41_05815 [Azovibrio sp.]|uniref:hypothetical protein n=1 Tax=Azovibrio sp. TaxID=1872673 RepID=UPI003C76EF75
MAQHIVKQRIQTEHFEVLIFSDAMKGYFEHHHLGDECGGGLWFEVIDNEKTLVDYDGTTHLPREVWQALETVGIEVGEDFK